MAARRLFGRRGAAASSLAVGNGKWAIAGAPDAANNIIGVLITRTGGILGDRTWTCTETTTESLCTYGSSGFPAPTYSPIGPRAR